jgi:hypothetical protein
MPARIMVIFRGPGPRRLDASGRLRVLYNDKDFEPYAAEVPPTNRHCLRVPARRLSRESARWSNYAPIR